MADYKLPVLEDANSGSAETAPVNVSALNSGWPLLDSLPFPVLEIRSDYQVVRVNPAATNMYGPATGPCYAMSHGHDRPCNETGETCPKLHVDAKGESATVRHAHETHKGIETHLVTAHPLSNGNVLEFHIPLEDSLARDGLTGLYLRDFFDQLVTRQIALLSRMQLGYAIVMLDLDHFKTVNDAHGHLVGDKVLRSVGHALREAKRDGDSIARWGGEEFCIFLPAADLGGARVQAARTQEAVRALRIPTPGGGAIAPTVSIGVAMALPKDSLSVVIERADMALYAAKEGGRDQIQLARYPYAQGPKSEPTP